MTQFQAGDRVRYIPTGEEWILFKVYGSYVIPFRRHRVALASDCTLICACTTTEEREACTRACDAVVL